MVKEFIINTPREGFLDITSQVFYSIFKIRTITFDR